jgi:hypothetical protein
MTRWATKVEIKYKKNIENFQELARMLIFPAYYGHLGAVYPHHGFLEIITI